MAAVSEYTYCCSPCPMIFCFEQLTQQRFFYSVQPPAYPEGFKQMVLISLIFFLQIFHPGTHIIENLLFIVHPQFQTGTFTVRNSGSLRFSKSSSIDAPATLAGSTSGLEG